MTVSADPNTLFSEITDTWLESIWRFEILRRTIWWHPVRGRRLSPAEHTERTQPVR